VEVQKPFDQKKKKKKGDLLIIYQETCPFSSSKTKNILKRKEVSEQSLDQVENIAPSTTSTPFKRALLQSRCSNRCSNSLRKLMRSPRFSRGEGSDCQAP